MKQLREFREAIQDMNNSGLTKQNLRNRYHMTKWGARKFLKQLPTEEEEIDGRGKKLYTTSKTLDELPRETRHTPIPVTVNHTEEIREPQHEKAQTTSEARSIVERVERAVKTVEADPVKFDQQPETSEAGVDTVWHLTDTHIGALVENEHGEVTYNTEKAVTEISEALEKFQLYTIQKDLDGLTNVDNIHLLLGGDIVEGTGIYQGQSHEVDTYINKQIEDAGDIILKVVKELALFADDINANLQIVCVPGNHGDMRVKGASNDASFDDIIYHMLNIGLNTLIDENPRLEGGLRLKRSDRSAGMTFPIRGYNAYLTHGENLKQHVGTSSGIKDALSIARDKDADLIFRGHYHMPKVEDVHGVPVVMTNSFKPGGSYEDSIQAYGESGTGFYTVTDEDKLAEARWINQ